MNKVNPKGGRLLVSHQIEDFTMHFIGNVANYQVCWPFLFRIGSGLRCVIL